MQELEKRLSFIFQIFLCHPINSKELRIKYWFSWDSPLKDFWDKTYFRLSLYQEGEPIDKAKKEPFWKIRRHNHFMND